MPVCLLAKTHSRCCIVNKQYIDSICTLLLHMGSKHRSSTGDDPLEHRASMLELATWLLWHTTSWVQSWWFLMHYILKEVGFTSCRASRTLDIYSNCMWMNEWTNVAQSKAKHLSSENSIYRKTAVDIFWHRTAVKTWVLQWRSCWMCFSPNTIASISDICSWFIPFEKAVASKWLMWLQQHKYSTCKFALIDHVHKFLDKSTIYLCVGKIERVFVLPGNHMPHEESPHWLLLGYTEASQADLNQFKMFTFQSAIVNALWIPLFCWSHCTRARSKCRYQAAKWKVVHKQDSKLSNRNFTSVYLILQFCRPRNFCFKLTHDCGGTKSVS